MKIDKFNKVLESLGDSLQEGVSNIPFGYYLVTDQFKVGFGSWGMIFRPGKLLKYEKGRKGPTLQQWDAVKGHFIPRNPPISGVETFDLTRYDWEPAQKKQIDKFLSGTKKISEKEFKKLQADAPKEIVGTVAEVMKKLKSLPPRTKIKVIIEK